MTCVHVLESFMCCINDGKKQSCIPVTVRQFVQCGVQPGCELGDLSLSQRGGVVYQSLERCHEQRARQTFSGDIGDNDAQPLWGNLYEVVIVSPNH